MLAVNTRRDTNQIGEASTERPQGLTPHGEAHLRHRHVAAPQQRHRAADPEGHQIRVRRLTEGELELPGQVSSRKLYTPSE